MQFIKTGDWEKCTKALAKRLITELAGGKRVLWLLCGGSNIPASVKVMETLPADATKNLAIFLTDERYGELGHVDSNAKQLHDHGFQAKEAIFVPVLSPGFSLEETRERYGQAVQRAIEHADVVIAQFGIGADGHIAGMLPHSPATATEDWVAAYQAPNYIRVTLTFPALRHITAAYVMVFGDEKKSALSQLRDETLPLTDQPSQILKELPEAYIYNDQIGEAA